MMGKMMIPRLKSLQMLIAVIIAMWMITFFIHEKVLPVYQAQQCQWSHLNHGKSDSNKVGQRFDSMDYDHDNSETKILFIADPQLIDNHTYPGRNPWLLKLSQHTTDVYLKKNYNAMMHHLKPDYVFFLGDYLDNGRSSSDEYFKREYRRFQSIFEYTKFGFKKDQNFFINVPGNHDLGISDAVKIPARDRFTKTFGKANNIVNINNVEFISIDSLSLMAENETINAKPRAFLDKFFLEKQHKINPRVLLSHVPLFRDPNIKPCGPLRENPIFHLAKGYQYQLVIENDLTQELLSRIRPDLIFSGDDHDYCDINHSEDTREITVKSISMAMGIWYPAVQLLTFSNDDDRFNYNTHLCYLTTPYYNIATYVVMAIISGIILLVWNLNQKKRFNYSSLPILNVQINNSKKINEMLNHEENSLKHSYLNLPNYTFTSNSLDLQNKFKLPGFFSVFNKSQVIQFFRQCFLLGCLVIFIYNLFILTI